MRHYIAVATALTALLLVAFLAVEAAGVSLLTNPSDDMSAVGGAAALLGVGLLMADVVLPVPSSAIMVAHGAMFGMVVGACLSLVGSVGAALLGFAVGRRGGPLLHRLVPETERSRADAVLSRWGTLAIVATRPVPLLAETTAILAGAARSLSWWQVALAATGGSIPAAVLYAVAGAAAADAVSGTLVFLVVLAIALLTWLVQRLRHRGAPDLPVTARENAESPREELRR